MSHKNADVIKYLLIIHGIINNMDNDQLFSYINLIVQHSVKLQTEIQDMQKEIMRLSNIIDNQALAVESMLDEMLKKE